MIVLVSYNYVTILNQCYPYYTMKSHLSRPKFTKAILPSYFSSLTSLNTNKSSVDSLTWHITNIFQQGGWHCYHFLYYKQLALKNTQGKNMHTVNEWVFTVYWRGCGHSVSTLSHTSCPVYHIHWDTVLTPDKRIITNNKVGHFVCPTLWHFGIRKC